MPEVRILAQYCKGCGLCVKACPKNALQMSRHLDRRGVRVVEVRPDAVCTICGNCAVMCPDAAIEVDA